VLLIVAYRRTRFTASTPKGLRAPIHRCPHCPAFTRLIPLLSTGYLVLQSWASRSERKRYKRWWGRFQNFTPSIIPLNPDLRFPFIFCVVFLDGTRVLCDAGRAHHGCDAPVASRGCPRAGGLWGLPHAVCAFEIHACVLPPLHSLLLYWVWFWFLFCGAFCWNPLSRATTHVVHFRSYPCMIIPVRGVMISLMSLSPASFHAQMWLR
jgi:hypothetical protein